ncbi:MAG: MFS transporter, partial [Planctomycetaceae bacterium]|nr:MFS transporter [Planctomycetaceae bacterium]
FGTIGWIVANALVSRILHADEKALPLQIAGGAGIVLGIYSFTLPHTPPPSAGQKATVRDVLGLDSLALMKNWSFCVFMFSSMAICVPLAAYYAFAQVFVNHAGFQDPAWNMSYGQMSEIFFMLVMPLFFKRLGVKWMLFVGMLAWVVRYGLFSLGADDGVMWMILVGILLHGICYDFFFVTGQIYVDKKAPPKIRGQAQGFLVLMTQGIGLGIGAQIVQRWIVNPNKAENIATLESPAKALRDQWGDLSDQTTAQANELWQESSKLLLQTHNWENIWQLCAIMAGVIMVLFLVLFHDDTKAAPTEGEVVDAYSENVPEDPNERQGDRGEASS